MKVLLALATMVVMGLLTGCETTQGSGVKQANEVVLDDLLDQVKTALSRTQTTLAQKNLPPLKKVALTIQTTGVRKVGGTVKLVVFTLGASQERSRSEQLDIVLVPPSPGNPRDVSTESITEILEELIVAASQSVAKARSGPLPLQASTVDIKIAFAVKNGGDGGAKLEIVPITLDLSGGGATNRGQSVVVSFENPK